MKGRVLLKMKRVRGWLVRLIYIRNRFLVNAFSPKGKLYSKQFIDIVQAEKFYLGLCKYLSKRKK